MNIISIKGGLQRDASGDFAQFGDTLIEREDGEMIEAFQIRREMLPVLLELSGVVFGGLPRMNANGGECESKGETECLMQKN